MDFMQEFSEYIKDRQKCVVLSHYRNINFKSKNIWATLYYYWYEDKTLTGINDRSFIIIDTSFLNTFVKFKLTKNKYTDVYVYNFIVYDKEQVAVKTIWRYWKKYRWNFFKNKVEPLKQELIEYLFHPSRLTFDV